MSPIRVRLSLTLMTSALLAPAGRAGLYDPDEKCPIPVRPNGVAVDLPSGPQADGPFPQLLLTLLNVADGNPARPNPDRKAVLDRTQQLLQRNDLGPAESAGLAADLLRLGKVDDALNVLAPLARDRTPDFRVLANLAHFHAVRGEWEDALRWHQAAFLDADFPANLAGATAAQRAWLKQLERTHYRRWLQMNRERYAARREPAEEDVFPLFPLRFVNDSGEFEPGKLAAAQRAKLPADAIPAVQQLLLWAPGDTALYWLLAELYAADGRLHEALYIFDRCADTRQFSNRAVMMAHRAAVRDAVAKLPKDTSADDIAMTPRAALPPREESIWEFVSVGQLVSVGVGFAAGVAALALMQMRAASRRRKP
ncbi:MAG: tetratricopeptide repeat protein [Fimbriiglobus sp.]